MSKCPPLSALRLPIPDDLHSLHVIRAHKAHDQYRYVFEQMRINSRFTLLAEPRHFRYIVIPRQDCGYVDTDDP